ncbi:transcription initiation factor TFIID subunit 7-like, partial [Chrysoperla carnea]|uniref:transcription initiation factor TFIID subunit 7-like n=1 Tax=Chrysoperla carnea TaxID=189513 RepID=UPI001D090F3A
MALMRKDDTDDASDLEVQFILRLPHESARILRALMHAGVSLKDRLSIDMYKDLRHVVFQLDNWVYYGKIYNLPTVIESLKTIDGKSFFKTADISQICVCTNEEFGSSEDELNINKSIANNNSENSRMKTNKKYNWPHGLTPPLKNVRKHRFRKTLPKEYVELSEIEREVRTLLRADNDAVSVRWE